MVKKNSSYYYKQKYTFEKKGIFDITILDNETIKLFPITEKNY